MSSSHCWVDGRAPEVHTDVDLSAMTTAKTGHTVSRLHIPHEGDDLRLLPSEDGVYRIISAGSNLLITDERDLGDVIWMGDYDDSITGEGQGVYRVGCSARIQRFIREVNAEGYGDIEELVSIPGMVGGLVCMNASIPNRSCISDHLVSVEVFDGKQIVTLERDECGFGYRTSRFKDGRSIILSAVFELPQQDPEVSRERVNARRARVKELHDHTAPSFGSVFSTCSSKVMRLVRFLGIRCGASHFSRITTNWLCCSGSFADSLAAIKRVERLHRLAGKPCEREVIVWE